MGETFTDTEKSVLSRFCTNTDRPIFGLVNLPEVVMGALFSRYSRSTKSLRRVLLDEFVHNQESGFDAIVCESKNQGFSQLVATSKAEEFYERVLVGFGDDSVAELGGAHIAIEDVSNIATKAIQDSRIGLSPLEKSTRYVYFNQKEDGKYRYVREPAIMDSEFASEYLQACDLLFDTYSSLIEPMTQQVQKEFPNDASASQRAYASAVRAKVCDVLRCLLPASTMTNTGIYGNGRAFEYLLLKMYSSQLGEIRQAAQSAHQQLGLMIPSFVKRANDAYGLSTQAYLKATCQSVSKQVEEHGLKLYDNQESRQDVQLVHFSDDAENKVVAAILFEHSDRSLSELYAMAKSLSQGQKESIISAYAGSRGNRRHKPGRAFEHCHYAFSLCGNFGMYRDLHRHRLMTQTRQPLSVYHGFELPPELVQAGFGKQVMEAVNFSSSVYKKIAAKMPLEAQYVVPMGFRLRWNINLNLREAYHLIELRSMPQGHIDYRRMVQNMFLEIKKVHPAFAAGMKFVDMSGAKLERLEAEKNIDKRIEEINKKYGTR